MVLFRGVEMGCVFNGGPNKILILGGKKDHSKANTTYEYDFLNKTVLCW